MKGARPFLSEWAGPILEAKDHPRDGQPPEGRAPTGAGSGAQTTQQESLTRGFCGSWAGRDLLSGFRTVTPPPPPCGAPARPAVSMRSVKGSGTSVPEQDRMRRCPCLRVALGGSSGNSQTARRLSLALAGEGEWHWGAVLKGTHVSDPEGTYGSGTSLKVTHHPNPCHPGVGGNGSSGQRLGPGGLGDGETGSLGS